MDDPCNQFKCLSPPPKCPDRVWYSELKMLSGSIAKQAVKLDIAIAHRIINTQNRE